MIDDILEVIDANDFKDAHIMGYSMGAMLAIGFLMRHPDRVRRVVAAGVGANYFAEHQSWREKVATAMLAEDPATIADPEARRFRVFGGQKGKDRLALAACMRSQRHAYSPSALHESTRPILVIAGENDTLAGSPVILAEAFADGRAVVLPNKDHMTAVGDPAYKRVVLDFFAAAC
jgi:pimeloyl-ACP methyl ester carboxylesterase